MQKSSNLAGFSRLRMPTTSTKLISVPKGSLSDGGNTMTTLMPVAKYTSIHMLLALLTGRKDNKVHQDVNTAFLNSTLDKTIYVKQPEGFIAPGEEDHVCLLWKALYALKQSPRAWFQLIAEVLVDFDFQQCESDPASSSTRMQTTNAHTSLSTLMISFGVIIVGNNEEDIAMIKWCLSDQFDMKDLVIATRFLGMEIEYRNDGSNKIHQNQYIQQLLEGHSMADCNPVTTPLDTSIKLSSITIEEAAADVREYASILGGLMFVACITRPDIMCAVSQLSQFLNNPSSKQMSAAKCILCYLRGASNLSSTPPLSLQGYSDEDWAGDMDTRRSTTGFHCYAQQQSHRVR